MPELTEEEQRLLARFREAKEHGYAEITITIHDHHITDMSVLRKERFRLPPTKLREV